MDPISRGYLDQLVDAEAAYQAADDSRAMVDAVHRQLLALASLAAHQAEPIAALGGMLVGEDQPTGEVVADTPEGRRPTAIAPPTTSGAPIPGPIR